MDEPRHRIKGNVSIPLHEDRAFASLEVQSMSRRKSLTRDRVKEHVPVNATLYGRELLPGVQASVGIFNLLDQRYSDPGSEERLQDAIEQDGRTLFVRLICRF